MDGRDQDGHRPLTYSANGGYTPPRFQWDPQKDWANRRKHGLSFEEAREVWTSGHEFLEIHDPEHSLTEQRFLAVGWTRGGLTVVSWTEPEDEMVRIISARRATPREIRSFHQRLSEKA